MCTHTRKAETKNNSRIMQSSSFKLEPSFLLEYYRKQNKCDLYATWLEVHLMQNLLLGSVLICFYDDATKSWTFPCSSEGSTSLPHSKYFRNYYRVQIKKVEEYRS